LLEKKKNRPQKKKKGESFKGRHLNSQSFGRKGKKFFDRVAKKGDQKNAEGKGQRRPKKGRWRFQGKEKSPERGEEGGDFGKKEKRAQRKKHT